MGNCLPTPTLPDDRIRSLLESEPFKAAHQAFGAYYKRIAGRASCALLIGSASCFCTAWLLRHDQDTYFVAHGHQVIRDAASVKALGAGLVMLTCSYFFISGEAIVYTPFCQQTDEQKAEPLPGHLMECIDNLPDFWNRVASKYRLMTPIKLLAQIVLQVVGFTSAWYCVEEIVGQTLQTTTVLVTTAEFVLMMMLVSATFVDFIVLLWTNSAALRIMLLQSVPRYIVICKGFNLLSLTMMILDRFLKRAKQLMDRCRACNVCDRHQCKTIGHDVVALLVMLLLLLTAPLILVVKLRSVAVTSQKELATWSHSDYVKIALLVNNLSNLDSLKIQHIGQAPFETLKKAGRNLSVRSQKVVNDDGLEDFGLFGNGIDLLKPVSNACSIGEDFLNNFNQQVIRRLQIDDTSRLGCNPLNLYKLLHLLSILLDLTDDEISDFLKPARKALKRAIGVSTV